MKQHVAIDLVAVRYSDGIDHVWHAWAPHALRCQQVFSAACADAIDDGDAAATTLRTAQYQAHVASEFAAGLVPPPSSSDPHAVLLATLASCRDALGVLAVRAEIDELDLDVAEIGLHAIEACGEAFRGVRSSTALVHAWVADDNVDPAWLAQEDAVGGPQGRWIMVGLWVLAAGALSSLAVLIVHVVLGGI
jgi:hypothetical protein